MKRICVLLALLLVLCGCGEKLPAAEAPEVPATEETAPTTQATLPPATETVTEPEPETQPSSPFHSGIREDGSFDEGTLFIGDSLTYGLVTEYLTEQNLLGDARYMAIPGAALTAYRLGPKLNEDHSPYPAYSPEFDRMYLYEAVELAGPDVTAVYFMMGTNYSEYATEKTYRSIAEHLLESCPNATVYLQIVPFETSKKVNYQLPTGWAKAVYEQLRAEGCERIFLVDTQSAIGYNLTSDGIHLTQEGQACWYEKLVAFAQENQIPQ